MSKGVKDLYYDDVIRFCTKFIDYIDIIIRKKNISLPKEEQSEPYFQRKRYYYYMEYCISKFPEIILFPTLDNIDTNDFIKVRCVPVFFIGITTDNIYADEFVLSPSEFYFHDINHSRIIYQKNEEYKSINKITNNDIISLMNKEVKEFYKYIESINFDKEIINLMRMLIFEVIHEDGFPFIKEIICKRLIREPSRENVERMEEKDGVNRIVQFEKLTSSTLGFALVKLRCGFFDKASSPNDLIVNRNYRTIDKIVEAARNLLIYFNCTKDPAQEKQLRN